MTQALGYAANHSFSRLKPMRFDREEVGSNDVEIEFLYCGVCHSDIHRAENDWGNTIYPCLPGHEIVGRVSKVGATVFSGKIARVRGRNIRARAKQQTARAGDFIHS